MLKTLLITVIEVYIGVLIARAVLSWFPVRPGTALSRLNEVLWRLTEPLLAPMRRVIPPAGGLDISFLIVVVVLEIVAFQVIPRL